MKLLIVDDDIYTREGLAETIPWNLYGIDDVMQAENGKEALHTVSWYLPDLIITDIRMPQKNGIDFCREAICLVPDCKIIFITGYMQTEYLKDAIDLSAVAFIEKPIQPEAVMEALEKAVGKIQKHQEHTQLRKENEAYQKNRFLQAMLQKGVTEEQLEELCRNCGFFCTRQERYLCIRIWEQGSAMDDAQCDLYLQQYFAEGTEFVLSTRLPDAEQCVAVFACEEKRQSEILRKYIDPGIYQVFLQVYKENPWRIREWYQALLQQFATKKQAMTEGAQIIALTRTFASQILNDYPESLTAVGESDVETYMRQLERTSNIRETEQQFDLLLNGMERCLVEQNRYSRLVSDIRTFCIRNLSDNTLGGQMISDRFHLSVTYLNQLFKQELSVTIKQYISEMRMERARELLTQTYDTVDEIAAKCGYSNGNYFAKAFRENQHMSPTDYRKQMEKRYEKEPRT